MIRGEVGDDEAGDAGEGQLHDRDLADEAGDHDDGEAHDRRQQRQDQGLAEVVGEDDQGDDCRGCPEQRRLPEPLRARGEGQPLLDELAAARQVRPAHEHRDHHQEEHEEGLDPRQRDREPVGREPALDLEVVEDVLEHPDRQTDQAGDPERREPGEERSGQRRDDLERERLGVELDDRGGEHAQGAREEGPEQRAGQREPVRREPDQHRARPRSPRRPASRARTWSAGRRATARASQRGRCPGG